MRFGWRSASGDAFARSVARATQNLHPPDNRRRYAPVTKDEAPVATKIVDVFLKDVLLRSYTLDWDVTYAPLFEQDFIDRTRLQMQADGYPAEQIAAARFIVRD
jgi:hypothetical protein